MPSMIGKRMRPPIESPGGKKNSDDQDEEAVLLEDRPDLPLRLRGRGAANRTFEPSSGGIGIRLKTIRTMLMHDEQRTGPDDESGIWSASVGVRER